MCVKSAYEAMLNGTPRPRSHDRWYIMHESFGRGLGSAAEGGEGSVTKNWQNMWHGGRAIRWRSAGFHALRRMRRSVGSSLILRMTSASWSTP
jgi:hypothetical protein